MTMNSTIAIRAALILTVLLAAQAAQAQTATAITPESVLAELNAWRSKSDLPPLRIDFRLQHAAEDRLAEMLELGYWSHVGPDGRPPFRWIPLRGYRFARAGENLAAGFDTAEVLVASWMESPGHRQNVLGPDYVDVGVAVLEGSTIRRAAGLSVVVLFARERIAEPITPRASQDRPRDTSGSCRR